MRRLAVYITLVLVLAASIAVGYFASDWPHWCRQLGWCAAGASATVVAPPR